MKSLVSVLVIVSVNALSGCSLIPGNFNKEATKLAIQGCKRFTQGERELIRADINTTLAVQHSILRRDDPTIPQDPPVWCGLRCPGESAPVVKDCLD